MKKRLELAQFDGATSAGLGPQSSLFAQEREEAWHACHERRRDPVPHPCKPRHDELEQLLDRHLGVGEHGAKRRLAEAAWTLGAHPLVDERLHMRRQLLERSDAAGADELVEVAQRAHVPQDRSTRCPSSFEPADVALDLWPQPERADAVGSDGPVEVAFQHKQSPVWQVEGDVMLGPTMHLCASATAMCSVPTRHAVGPGT